MKNIKGEGAFFDKVIKDFYKEIGSFRSSVSRGQIFWTYVRYSTENLQFWRPKKLDDTKTCAAEFVISSSTADAFNRNIPLQAPPLKINEEFIVVRAKKRPVILLSSEPEKIEAREVRGGEKVNLNLCIVAPLYTVSDKDGFAKYDEDVVNRTRMLEFPNLFFLPEYRRIRHSICRLDCIQACFSNHMEATEVCLNNQVLNVFLGQVNFYLTGEYKGDYQVYRECLQNPELC